MRALLAAALVLGGAGCYDLDALPGLYEGDLAGDLGGTDDLTVVDAAQRQPFTQLSVLAGGIGGAGAGEGTGPTARLDTPTGVCTDGTDVYVVDSGSATVWKWTAATGAVTLVAGRPYVMGVSAGGPGTSRFMSPRTCAIIGTDLYVTDYAASTVRKVDLVTGTVVTAVGHDRMYSGNPGYLGFPYGLTALNNVLYIVDTGLNSVFSYVPASDTLTRIAGDPFTGSYDYVNGTGVQARFRSPTGVTSDGATELFVADKNNRVVRSVLIGGTHDVALVAGTPGVYTPKNGTLTTSAFYGPSALVYDAGILYITDGGAVRKADLAGNAVTTYTGDFVQGGSTDGALDVARYSFTNLGLTRLASGTLILGDEGNHVLRRIQGGMVDTIVGTVAHADLLEDTGVAARFSSPLGLAELPGGVLVADQGNHVIRKVDAAGIATRFAGTGAPGHDDGNALTLATFQAPTGITVDERGRVFVSDIGNNQIRVIANGQVRLLAGDPKGNAGARDGIGAGASFNNPRGMVAHRDALYVADGANDAIRRVEIATGATTTFVNGAAISYAGCGQKGVRGPHDLALDLLRDKLYVASTNNCLIVSIDLHTGMPMLLAGNSAGTTDGVGVEATFEDPRGLLFDGDRTLYVADGQSGLLRAIDVTTGAVTTVAGVAERDGVAEGPLPARLSMPTGLAWLGGAIVISAPSENALLRLQ